LAEMLVTVARRYNMAMICPEKNSVGVGCCLKLKEMNYPNLYFDKLHKNIYMVYTAMDTANELPGFETGTKKQSGNFGTSRRRFKKPTLDDLFQTIVRRITNFCLERK